MGIKSLRKKARRLERKRKKHINYTSLKPLSFLGFNEGDFCPFPKFEVNCIEDLLLLWEKYPDLY